MRDVGARLVLQDAQQFIRQAGDASSAMSGFEKAGMMGAAGFSAFNVAGMPIVATLGNIASAIGFVINMGKKLIQTLTGMVRQAMGATAAYESLSMSMASLVAKEIRAKDETLDMEGALDLSTKRAEELLGWIEQLAIASPFDQRGVALAFKTGLTYGFTSEQAQKLTETLVNFATATGQTSAVVQQLSFPLGQIKNTGRVLRQDLMQLTNASVDVTGILEKMGYGWEDVTAGIVKSDEFLKAFVETIDEDFGGAAKRSANTVNGLLNSLQDLTEIGLRKMFGPAIQSMLPLLNKMVETAQAFMPVAEAMGIGLAEIGNNIVKFLLPGIESFGEKIGIIEDDAETTASNMFDWGAKTITNFAEGMASAINQVLTVLIDMGKKIADLIKPQSPPPILPEIDEWGAATINEYLKGFTQADFSIFDRLSGMLTRLIQTGADPEDEGLIPSILGTREGIAGAIKQLRETGNVGEETLDNIFETARLVNEEARAYTRALFDIELAQLRLNEVTMKYQQILQPMYAELNAIAQRRQEVIEQRRIDELARILEDQNAPALAKELAAMELREMQIKKNIAAVQEQYQTEAGAAQQQMSEAQRQLMLQEQLINAQLEYNASVKQQTELMERLAEAQAEAVGLDLGEVDPGGGIFDAFEDRIEELKTQISSIFDPLKDKWAELKEVWTDVFDSFGGWMDEHKQLWKDVYGSEGLLGTIWAAIVVEWNKIWGEGGIFGKGGIVDQGFQAIGDTWSTIWENITTAWNDLWTALSTAWTDFWSAVDWENSWINTKLLPALREINDFFSGGIFNMISNAGFNLGYQMTGAGDIPMGANGGGWSGSAGGVSNTTNNQFSFNNNINNQSDAAMIVAYVQQSLIYALQGIMGTSFSGTNVLINTLGDN